MRFEFATATRIIFGAGVRGEAARAAAALGQRVLLVTGGTPARVSGCLAGMPMVPFAVSGEPEIETVRRGVALAHAESCDVVVAIGGGSAIDTGKALAALLTNQGDPLEYLEVIGRGQPLGQAPAPFIAMPTTAGTGSEVTRNAVLGSPENRVKASLRSERMLPRLALI